MMCNLRDQGALALERKKSVVASGGNRDNPGWKNGREKKRRD